MPKEEWGTKRLCPTTGKRFYDLNKSPIVSPYTGEVVVLDTGTKTRVAIAEQTKKAKSREEDLVDDEEDLVEDEADVDLGDDLLEDEEDNDDVSLDDIADVSSEEDET